jgi:uncharacterized protein (DUF2249 family)
MPEADQIAILKSLDKSKLVALDVRDIIENGEDPFNLIQSTVEKLTEGQVLKIINTFEPRPLISFLSRQGFQSWVEILGDDLIETYFYTSKAMANQNLLENSNNSDDWEAVKEKYKGRIKSIDVSTLEMPQPMIFILETLESLDPEFALQVSHRKIPVYIFDELKEKGWEYLIHRVTEDEIQLLIYR